MYFINSKPSYYHLLNSIPVLIPDFNNPFPVTGTGMENCIPKFWERERERKIAFPTFGNGNGNEKIIPNFRERESEAGIPGNGREREFPLTPALWKRGKGLKPMCKFMLPVFLHIDVIIGA